MVHQSRLRKVNSSRDRIMIRRPNNHHSENDDSLQIEERENHLPDIDGNTLVPVLRRTGGRDTSNGGIDHSWEVRVGLSAGARI